MVAGVGTYELPEVVFYNAPMFGGARFTLPFEGFSEKSFKILDVTFIFRLRISLSSLNFSFDLFSHGSRDPNPFGLV